MHRAGVDGTFHALRHRYGTLAYQATRDLVAVGRQMGHSSPVTTAIYAAASDDVADEISQNIEAIIGTTTDTAPKAAPKHPTANDSTTSRFASLNLQFGRNYDPTSRR